jgi:hypothetical protein
LFCQGLGHQVGNWQQQKQQQQHVQQQQLTTTTTFNNNNNNKVRKEQKEASAKSKNARALFAFFISDYPREPRPRPAQGTAFCFYIRPLFEAGNPKQQDGPLSLSLSLGTLGVRGGG